ncbi:MAG: phenylalanine--tRNA ligase subunit beta [Bacilli bacterium]
MKVSYNLLKRFVDLDGITVEEVAKKLTLTGIEVEAITPVARGDHLVIGQIKKAEKHPDSTHLQVLEVDLGTKYGHRQIVCGAPNAKVGQKVIVARVGATLGTDFKINESKILGVTSYGMCCSLPELGVDTKFLRQEQIEGIEVLPSTAPVGEEEVLAYLGLDDLTLDLKIPANRPDAQAVYNLAREVGRLCDRKVKIPPTVAHPQVKTDVTVSSNTDKCRQFAIQVVRDITVKPSPRWMQLALTGSGIRAINNLVDIGNYVMLLTGQPLHMYDLDSLPGQDFIVSDQIEDEKFVALDEQVYHVLPGDLAVTVNGEIMCLGGVMGSRASGIGDQTKNVAIEAANFHFASIRKTSTRLNLPSDASLRFAKGINPSQTEEVLKLATDLVLTLADGKAISELVNYDVLDHTQAQYMVNSEKINARLGTDFTLEEIEKALLKAGMEVKKVTTDQLQVIVPSARIDITDEVDLSEEVIRVVGFDRVANVLPKLDASLGLRNPQQKKIFDLRHYLRLQGLDEILTYGLVDDKTVVEFAAFNRVQPHRLLNPMSPDRAVTRTNLLPSMLDALRYNYARQNHDLSFFEVSNVYGEGSEKTHLAIGLLGEKHLRGHLLRKEFDFFDLKGYMIGILDLLGINASRYQFSRLPQAQFPEFHPGRSAGLYVQKDLVAILGELHPQLKEKYDLGKNAVAVLEVDLTTLLRFPVSIGAIKLLDRFPAVVRDLALIVQRDISAKAIVETCKKAGKSLLKSVDIFDVYTGEGVAHDCYSLALRLTFRANDRTLADAEVQNVVIDILSALKKTHQVEIRE